MPGKARRSWRVIFDLMRPTPYALVLESLGPERFPPIQRALASRQLDARDRDSFLMIPEAVGLVREMRPAGGLGEGMDQLVAFVHHAYLFWDAGEPVLEIDRSLLDALLAGTADLSTGQPHSAWYVQLPERRLWARVLEDAAHEPLDGFFADGAPQGTLRVLGVLGLRPDRDGFSAVEVEGPRPGALERDDATPPFSANLPGGAAADLYAIGNAGELLELGWRTAGAWPAGAKGPPA